MCLLLDIFLFHANLKCIAYHLKAHVNYYYCRVPWGWLPEGVVYFLVQWLLLLGI